MIYHITSINYYQSIQSSGNYLPENFHQDGFIHCSTRDQVIRVANAFYTNQMGLILLELDERNFKEHLVFENLEGGEELFPHVYSSIPFPFISRVALLVPSEIGFGFPNKWFTKEEFANMVK